MDNLSKQLVRKPAIIALKLLSFLQVDSLEAPSVEEKFPELFSGLGKMEGRYRIRLNEDAEPFALTTPEGLLYLYFQR